MAQAFQILSELTIFHRFNVSFTHHEQSFTQYPDIPAIGYSAPLLSYIGAFRYFTHGRDMMQEGYDKVRLSSLPNTSMSFISPV